MPPTNPRLPTIGAALFGLFALGFVLATVIHLNHDRGALHDTVTVLLYAAAPLPFLVVGALACLLVQPATYRRWMAAFAVLVLLWMVAGATALFRVGAEEAVVVLLHLMVAGAGGVAVSLIRGVARQRGLEE